MNPFAPSPAKLLQIAIYGGGGNRTRVTFPRSGLRPPVWILSVGVRSSGAF
jgi:hypothetical protein